jgi:hypothetical protein
MDATMPILEKKPTVVLVIQVVVLGVVHIPLHLVLERGERGELGEVAGERVEEENRGVVVALEEEKAVH